MGLSSKPNARKLSLEHGQLGVMHHGERERESKLSDLRLSGLLSGVQVAGFLGVRLILSLQPEAANQLVSHIS